jgi:hypothetical protein
MEELLRKVKMRHPGWRIWQDAAAVWHGRRHGDSLWRDSAEGAPRYAADSPSLRHLAVLLKVEDEIPVPPVRS